MQFYRSNPVETDSPLQQAWIKVIDYIKNLHFAKEDVDYLRIFMIFDEDFLNYLENFRFTGDIYCHSGRHSCISERASGKSHCSDYGGHSLWRRRS